MPIGHIGITEGYTYASPCGDRSKRRKRITEPALEQVRTSSRANYPHGYYRNDDGGARLDEEIISATAAVNACGYKLLHLDFLSQIGGDIEIFAFDNSWLAFFEAPARHRLELQDFLFRL
jgi:hypothetical protein